MSEAEIPNSPDSSFESDTDFLDTDSFDGLLSSLEELGSNDEAIAVKSETEVEPSWEETVSEQNHQLLHRSAQLQQTLKKAEAQLEEQQWQLRQAEDLNAQQNDELNAAYEQNLSLSQELKRCRLKEQQQTEKVAQLTHQLQVSQQRVAQLERECALIQKQFQDQSYKLAQGEKQSRELSLRLQQQRRHTWQFKSALNKCLETNAQRTDLETIPPAYEPSEPISAWSSQPKNPLSEEPEFKQDFTKGENTQLEVEATPETVEFEISLPEFKQSLMVGQSPAPTVSVHRKKRKSYAAVELPKFNV